MTTQQVSAVVLAAGKGTRMKSARPKVLFEVLDRPLLSWVCDAVAAAGVSDVVVVVGHGKDEVTAHLAANHPTTRTVEQREQKGTGHAVMTALDAVVSDAGAGAVLVVCGDTPRLSSSAITALIERHRQSGAAVAMWTATLEDPTGYGRVIIEPSVDGSVDGSADSTGNVVAIVEHKDATPAQQAITLVNPGVYCFDAAFLAEALPQLGANNAAGEIYLTDVVQIAAKAGKGVVAVAVDADMTLGINDRVQLAAAERWARSEAITRRRLAGVTVVDDAGVKIGAHVVVGVDSVINAGVALSGKTTIGQRVVIGQGCVISDCVIDDDAVIHPYSVCDQAHIGAGAIVGPFARLRVGADVGEDAHVGNFVELKKTALGKGSKANHLAYLGDAVIGTGVNVGAGTITCNYDGVGKYQTTLGDNVFVGSNSTLVAPINVGDGAYVAAGSVVTADVDKDAVAFGRARQENKAGRAPVVRAKNAAQAAAAKTKSGGR
jgi:bifunctional UDP-N-acetylglucosamine pyrophosphorylase/glucosamine-1-phosphate N-acetyltransferase